MRERTIIGILAVLALVLGGCDEKPRNENVSGIQSGNGPTVSAGQFHNEVLAAFEKRAPLDSVTGMRWEEWQETILASIEEASAAHDIPFDREQTLSEMENLLRAFHALETATGVDPGMLHTSESPEADFAILVGQLREWKLIDERTRRSLVELNLDESAARASATTDEEMRDVYDIGAASREFWAEQAKKKDIGPRIVPPDEDQPCKVCQYGSALSDMLGAVVGRFFCLGEPNCPARTAAMASLIFNMIMEYCANHNCNGDDFGPPLFP